MRKIRLIFLSILTLGCGQNLSNPHSSNLSVSSALTCSCSLHHHPVCGTNGVTYSNACVAQCHVADWQNGACQGEGNQNPNCNPSSGVVCGQPPMPECPNQACPQVMPEPITYSSECDMVSAGASLIRFGTCS